MSTTFSDTSSTSSDRTIPSKKMSRMSLKEKTKEGDSTPSYMIVKNGNVEGESLISEFDIEKLVNCCKKIVGNDTQKTC
jgi:hypothetical protein